MIEIRAEFNAKIVAPFYPHVQHMLIIVKSGKQKAEHKIPCMFYYRLNSTVRRHFRSRILMNYPVTDCS